MRQWNVARATLTLTGRLLETLLLVGVIGLLAPPPAPSVAAPADPATPSNRVPAAGSVSVSGTRPWSAAYPSIGRDIGGGAPLVVDVVVPLCDNALIHCGADFAGQPGRPSTNLYWGAIFGARRMLDRPNSGWARVALDQHAGPLLERAVYRREVAGEPWGMPAGTRVEVIAVLEAVHGAEIDRAVEWLYRRSARGSRVAISGPSGT
ncbi:MAG: hypothetical protein JW751_26950 [Polyangiaceae bacterium]|nr:hypothetical protein [Polyangiaceae bacterium]